MDALVVFLLGLLIVMAIPGLILMLDDLLGAVETRRISRPDIPPDTTDIEPCRISPIGSEPERW